MSLVSLNDVTESLPVHLLPLPAPAPPPRLVAEKWHKQTRGAYFPAPLALVTLLERLFWFVVAFRAYDES